MAPRLTIAETDGLGERLAALCAEQARAAIASRGAFAIALPGGSVAAAFFPRLARAPVDWARTDVFWVDERAVPPDDPESNYAAARRLLLDPATVPAERIHRLPGDAPDLDRAARAYGETLEHALGAPPRLDLVLLGLGPDGHVASIFPGHPLLGESDRWVAAVFDSPKPPARRLTLTLPVLTGASLVIVAAMGRAKAGVVREAVEDADSRLPAALVMRSARAELLLDAPAASELSRG